MGATHTPTRSISERLLIGCAGTITWSALAIQLVLFLNKGPELGLSPLGAFGRYFTFMTNLSGLGVAQVFTSELVYPGGRKSGFFSGSIMRGALLAYSLLVFAVYHFLLAHAWDPQGGWKLAAVLLHYVVPFLYMLFWLMLVPRGCLRWAHVLWWQVFPLGYVAVIMLLGRFTGIYPYAFLEVEKLGWPTVGRTMALVLAGYLAVAALVVFADRALATRRA